jgi:hypothetical protein
MEGEKDGFPVTAMREIKLLQSLRQENVLRLIEIMVSKGEHHRGELTVVPLLIDARLRVHGIRIHAP